MKATKTMHVDAKPERVMSFFRDSTATPAGMTMTPVHESPDVVGNLYEWTLKMFGLPRKGVTVYTDYVPAERLALRHFGAMEGASTVTIEPEEGGSKVTMEMETRLPIPLIGRFFDPILRREWEKNVEWGKPEIEEAPEVEKTKT